MDNCYQKGTMLNLQYKIILLLKREKNCAHLNESSGVPFSFKGTSIPLSSNLVTWSNHLELTCYSALYHTKTIWFWHATTKINWSFQTILTRSQYYLLGGMLVALKFLIKLHVKFHVPNYCEISHTNFKFHFRTLAFVRFDIISYLPATNGASHCP